MKERTGAALERTLAAHPRLHACREAMERALVLLKECFESGGKILVCGNGGSAADSEHVVGELMKSYRLKRKIPASLAASLEAAFPDGSAAALNALQGALPAISLVSHSSLISALSNDVSAELVFAQQVYGYGRAGDVLLGLSTSGRSANVLRAFQVARVLDIRSICLTGARSDERLGALVDVVVSMPEEETPAIQELHLPVYHCLCEMVESELFAE